MQFKYKFHQVNHDKIPLLDVQITNKETGQSTQYRALLDSGAYANIFHSDIAEIIGIDLEKIKGKQVFSGVEDSGRKLSGKPCFVELMVKQGGKSHRFDAFVIFTDQVVDSGYGLLGRQFFFDRFDEIAFNFPDNSFCLRIEK